MVKTCLLHRALIHHRHFTLLLFPLLRLLSHLILNILLELVKPCRRQVVLVEFEAADQEFLGKLDLLSLLVLGLSN